MTISLLEGVKEAGAQQTRIMIIGSAAEYGLVPPELLPVGEGIGPNPISKYGASMVARTAVAVAYRHMGLKILIARVFNILGQGLPAHLSIGAFAKQIARIERGEQEPVLFTGELSAKRDFLDIRDISKAIYLLALHGEAGEIYNVCCGKSFAIASILRLCLESSSLEIQVKTMPSKVRSVDIPDMVGNNQKLRQATGWQPAVSLEGSVKRTLRFWREHP